MNVFGGGSPKWLHSVLYKNRNGTTLATLLRLAILACLSIGIKGVPQAMSGLLDKISLLAKTIFSESVPQVWCLHFESCGLHATAIARPAGFLSEPEQQSAHETAPFWGSFSVPIQRDAEMQHSVYDGAAAPKSGPQADPTQGRRLQMFPPPSM